jgi:hemerythrin-like domain-containing protein
MKAISILMEEHEVILRALDVLDELAGRAAAGREVPAAAMSGVLDFLSSFADAHHHAKEEGILFPALEEMGFPHDGGPVGVMLHEHEQGRALIAALREAAAAPDAIFAQAARAYSALLRQHIDKENHILFRMADQAIEGAGRERVEQAFEDFERAHAQQRAVQQQAIAGLASQLGR